MTLSVRAVGKVGILVDDCMFNPSGTLAGTMVTLKNTGTRLQLSTDFKEWITITRTSCLDNRLGTSTKFESVIVRLEGLGRLLDVEDIQRREVVVRLCKVGPM